MKLKSHSWQEEIYSKKNKIIAKLCLQKALHFFGNENDINYPPSEKIGNEFLKKVEWK